MEQISDLRTAIFSRRPALGKIYREHGNDTIFDYVNSWKVAPPIPDSLLVEVIKTRLSSLYGHTVADAVSAQLRSRPIISTIDHHGFLNHPFFINSNLLFSLNNHLDYLVCLSTAGISMNNSSWPGCLVYHAGETKLAKLPLFKTTNNMDTVFASRPFSEKDLDGFFLRLGRSALSADKKARLEIFVKQQVSKNILSQNNFSNQAALASFSFWQNFFPGAPKVVYLTIEDIVSDILVKLLSDKKNLFYMLMSQEAGWKLIEKYFHAAEGSFINPQKGSFLFWGLNGNGGRVHLRREGKELVGEGQRRRLTAETIASDLKAHIIYPTTLTCFLVLLNFGITCVGGFNQTTWLTGIKRKFLDLLADDIFANEYIKLSKVVGGVPTDNFAETAFIKSSGIDILWEAEPGIYEEYRSLSKRISLAESIDGELPEIYPIVFPASERIA